MMVARVVGNVWATRKHAALEGAKLLLVQKIDCSSGEVISGTSLALDTEFGAGVGDTVLLVDEGNTARTILNNQKAPVRLVLCGVVDSVYGFGRSIRYH